MLGKRETRRAVGVQRKSPPASGEQGLTELERGLEVNRVWGKVRRAGRPGSQKST